MRILGIDPGTYHCGYGVIESGGSEPQVLGYGVLRCPRKSIAERLSLMHQGLAEVIDRFAPDAVALETAFYGKSVKAALRIGEARGVILLAAASRGLSIAEYSPAEVKKAVVGHGRAQKPQVQRMVKVLLRLAEVPSPEDASDALAIAICHLHRVSGPEA